MSISLKLLELASTEKPSEIPETRNVLIQSYSRSNSGRPFDFTSSEILTWNTVFPGSSSEFRFLPEGIREVRILGTPGRNFLFFIMVRRGTFVFSALSLHDRYSGDGIWLNVEGRTGVKS